ncbi:hypothetical protein L873DRAFT_1355138 [Choiromyces venosus 120613-1]|uniref:C2H2-type domain-containing protein n=1 Tax=Choiromyces venosus 120613-1 TaxID=1336337 RepID=A0A3N4K1H6_9PEZI|nr:hypothetical protein L873DRAFT_1355138 [Choiromyces venosus 120613-1]
MDQGLKAADTVADLSQKDNKVTLLASEGHIIRNLYNFCQCTIGAIFSRFDDKHIMTREWRELKGRLNTWEDGFSVMEGELDQLFVKTRNKYLRESTCIILCSLARSLSMYMNSIDAQWSPKEILTDMTEIVITLMPMTKGFLEVLYDNPDSEDCEVEDLMEDINDSIESLYDLVPSTERLFLLHHNQPQEMLSPCLSSGKSVTPEREPVVGVGIYRVKIHNKFPDISDDLAMCLAEVNWERWTRVRNMKPQVPGAPINTPSMTKPEPSTIWIDSGLGLSVQTGDVPMSGHGGISDTRSEVSTISWGTTHQTTSGKARIPRPPVEKLSSEITFDCPICYKHLKGITSEGKWKEHVLKDLQPYSCLFSNCPERNVTFDSKHLWVDHEFLHHRPQKVTMFICRKPCKQKFTERCNMLRHIIDDHLHGAVSESDVEELVDLSKIKVVLERIRCPFCLDQIEETKASIKSHIGTHLDEIALKVLPLDMDESSDISGGSVDADIFDDEGDTRSGILNLNPSTTIYEGPVQCLVAGCKHSTTVFLSELEYRRHALSHQNDKITCPFPHLDPALQTAFPDFGSFMTHLKGKNFHELDKAESLSSCEFCYNGSHFSPQGLYNHLTDCDFSYISQELRTPKYIDRLDQSSNTTAGLLLPQLYARVEEDKGNTSVTVDIIESWRGSSYIGDEGPHLPEEVPWAETKELREKKTISPLKEVRQDRELLESDVGSPEERTKEEQAPIEERQVHQSFQPAFAPIFRNVKNKEKDSSYTPHKSPRLSPHSQSDDFLELSDINNSSTLAHALDVPVLDAESIYHPTCDNLLDRQLVPGLPCSNKGITPPPKEVRQSVEPIIKPVEGPRRCHPQRNSGDFRVSNSPVTVHNSGDLFSAVDNRHDNSQDFRINNLVGTVYNSDGLFGAVENPRRGPPQSSSGDFRVSDGPGIVYSSGGRFGAVENPRRGPPQRNSGDFRVSNSPVTVHNSGGLFGAVENPRRGPPQSSSSDFWVSNISVTVHNTGGLLSSTISSDLGEAYANGLDHTDSCHRLSQKSDNMNLCFCPAEPIP